MSECCNYTVDDVVPTGYEPPVDWAPCMITMLRVMIGDFDEPYTYSDERLYETLKVGAFYVSVDLNCCDAVSKPTAEYCSGIMSVNPLSYPSFANLMVLKSACIINQSAAHTKSLIEGVRATCGPAALTVASQSAAFNALFKYGPCAAYQELKEELCFKCPIQSAACCEQILGPFVSEYVKRYNNGSYTCYR